MKTTVSAFKKCALSFPGTEENTHFDRIAYKISGKRIFATIHEESQSANIKLPVADQSVFCDFSNAIYPVDNKWGLKGWTTFELEKIPEKLIFNALETAYNAVINKQ